MGTKTSEEGIFSFITRIPRRITWIILMLIIVVSYLVPFILPIEVSQSTYDSFDAVESVPEGGYVIIGIDTDAASWPILGAIFKAVNHHLGDKDVHYILCGITSWDVPGISKQIIDENDLGEYGVDYVNLGMLPGMEIAVEAFSGDLKFLKNDYYGTSLDELKLFEDIQDANDIDFIIDLATLGAAPDWWVAHWSVAYGVPVLDCTSAHASPAAVNKYKLGLIPGYIAGMRGAAEYEALVKLPGKGTTDMNMISLSLTTVVVFIVLGNIDVLVEKLRGEKI